MPSIATVAIILSALATVVTSDYYCNCYCLNSYMFTGYRRIISASRICHSQNCANGCVGVFPACGVYTTWGWVHLVWIDYMYVIDFLFETMPKHWHEFDIICCRLNRRLSRHLMEEIAWVVTLHSEHHTSWLRDFSKSSIDVLLSFLFRPFCAHHFFENKKTIQWNDDEVMWLLRWILPRNHGCIFFREIKSIVIMGLARIRTLCETELFRRTYIVCS